MPEPESRRPALRTLLLVGGPATLVATFFVAFPLLLALGLFTHYPGEVPGQGGLARLIANTHRLQTELGTPHWLYGIGATLALAPAVAATAGAVHRRLPRGDPYRVALAAGAGLLVLTASLLLGALLHLAFYPKAPAVWLSERLEPLGWATAIALAAALLTLRYLHRTSPAAG